MNITKWIAKKLIPSPDKLAKLAAERIAAEINACGKTDAIAKYSTMLQSVAEKTVEINGMLTDGVLDASETDRLAKTLAPLFARVEGLL